MELDKLKVKKVKRNPRVMIGWRGNKDENKKCQGSRKCKKQDI